MEYTREQMREAVRGGRAIGTNCNDCKFRTMLRQTLADLERVEGERDKAYASHDRQWTFAQKENDGLRAELKAKDERIAELEERLREIDGRTEHLRMIGGE
jgi:flagellar motility protein MotE (MotC chaperone)